MATKPRLKMIVTAVITGDRHFGPPLAAVQIGDRSSADPRVEQIQIMAADEKVAFASGFQVC
jgi:hypothetical protein